MSKNDIKKAGNRTWDVINLIACSVGGAILTFGSSTTELLNSITVGQVVGSVLLATAIVRVAHLVYKEER